MEDAKITDPDITIKKEEPPLYQQGEFPSVITTDDLVLELGKNVVNSLNKDKLLKGLLKKSKEVEARSKQLEAIGTSFTKEIENVKNASKLFEISNSKLIDELAKVKATLAEKEKQLSGLREVEPLKESVKSLGMNNRKLSDDLTKTKSALVETEKQLAIALKEVEPLKESNKAYELKNRQLGVELANARQNVTIQNKNSDSPLLKEISNLKTSITLYEAKNRKLSEELMRLTDKVIEIPERSTEILRENS